MSFLIYPATVLTGAAISIPPTQQMSDCFEVGILNDSSFGLDAVLPGNHHCWVPPQSGLYMASEDFYGQDIRVQPMTVMSGSFSGLPQQLTIVGYNKGEAAPPSGTIIDLSKIVVVANAVNTTVSGTSQLSNTGNPPGSNVINIQPSDSATNTWTADNSGNLIIKGDNGGTLTTLLQLIAGASPGVKLAALGILTEVLGNLTVDQALAVTGTSTLAGAVALAAAGLLTEVKGNLTVDQALTVLGGATLDSTLNVLGASSLDNGAITTDGAGKISPVSFNGVKLGLGSGSNGVQMGKTSVNDCIDQTSSDLFLKAVNGRLQFQTGGSTKFTIREWNSNGNATVGSGTTISHGLSATPDLVLMTPRISQPGSATAGTGTWGSTTFQGTVGAGTAAAWFAARF